MCILNNQKKLSIFCQKKGQKSTKNGGVKKWLKNDQKLIKNLVFGGGEGGAPLLSQKSRKRSKNAKKPKRTRDFSSAGKRPFSCTV